MSIREVEGPGWKAPLYVRFETQVSPQDAFVEFTPEAVEDMQLRADWNAEVGNAIPMSVFHGRKFQWSISPRMRADAIKELLREIEPLTENLLENYYTEWDGNNVVGRFRVDVSELMDEIEQLCESYSSDRDALTEVWPFYDWVCNTLVTDDHSIRITGPVDFVIYRKSPVEGLEVIADILAREAEEEHVQLEEDTQEIVDSLKQMQNDLEEKEFL